MSIIGAQSDNGFPLGEIIRTGFLEVDEHVKIYYEQRGNRHGIPVVINHGGPGGHCKPEDSQWFDPEHYNITLYDQRGCGQSVPTVANSEVSPTVYKHLTPAVMVEDLEKLRQHLGVHKWVVFGGSWGSTLSLTYAQHHPEHVRGLIITGIFLNCPDEMKAYFNKEQMAQRFGQLGSDAFDFLSEYAESQGVTLDRNDPHSYIKAYYQLCVKQAKRDSLKCAQYVWEAYEMFNDEPTAASLSKLKNVPTADEVEEYFISHSIFETIIFRSAYQGFNVLEPELVKSLRQFRSVIIQGVDDTEAPPEFAERLVTALKANDVTTFQYEPINNAKHTGSFNSPLGKAIIAATNSFIHKPQPAVTPLMTLQQSQSTSLTAAPAPAVDAATASTGLMGIMRFLRR